MRVQPSSLRKLSSGFRLFSTAQAQARQIPCIVNGAEVFTNITSPTVNPYSGEQIGEINYATVDVVDEAAKRSHEAHKDWAQVSLEERLKIGEQVGVEVKKREAQFMEALMVDGGGAGMKAGLEIDALFCGGAIPKTIEWVRTVLGEPEIRENRGCAFAPTPKGIIMRKPRGVAACIGPFNFPLFLTGRSAFQNIMVGNGCIIKPSPHTTLYAQPLVEAFEAAGVPKGLINIVHGEKEVVDMVIDHDLVKHVSFIGSSAVGREIAARAAANFTKFSLELGGKSPCVLLDDCDIGNAIGNIIPGFCLHAGQICVATTKILIDEKIKDTIAGGVVGALGTLEYARPDGSGLVSPLVQKASIERCDRMVKDAVDKGAKILFQGTVPEDLKSSGGFYYPPTLLGDVPQNAELYDEEAFGPVSYINSFSTEEEALQLANNSKYGLAAAVHTTNIERGEKFASKMEAGAVSVNAGTLIDDMDLPFGGVKNSGWGRNTGREAIEDLTEVHAIHVWPEGKSMS